MSTKEKITVAYVYPPIPRREFDYCAYRDPEARLVGWGPTADAAEADLLQLEADAEEEAIMKHDHTVLTPMPPALMPPAPTPPNYTGDDCDCFAVGPPNCLVHGNGGHR